MAFGRKKKDTGRTDYIRSRYQDDRYGDMQDSRPENDRTPARRAGSREAGYGVSDSYLRQNEFGRPESYGYDRIREEGDYFRNPGAYPDPDRDHPYGEHGTGRDYPYGAGGRDRYPSGGGAGGKIPQGARAAGQSGPGRERWQDDPYDDRYQGSYDGFDSYGNEVRRRSPQKGYGRPYAYEEEPRRRASRRTREADGMYEESSYGRPVRGKKPGKKKRGGKGSFAVKLILLILAAVLIFVFYRFSRMDRVHLGNILKNEGASSPEGYQNFVIYGVDSREGQLTKDSHSDTIVICSINKSTKEAKMVSVYRDTYLDNTNGEFRKATECYFFGGPERSINMLNKNLDLDIGDYIAVNFNAVIKAVDLIGGVDINVTEDELPYINGYQTENAQVTGAQITPVESAGYQHLNGIQALAYCRIRYTAGDDYRRTERQREVLTQIFDNAKKQGTTRMLQVMDAMMPYISTSFSNTELMNLVGEMQSATLGDQTGFPFEQQPADTASGDCVVPVNLAQNVRELHSFLFGQADYTPSATVEDISQTIISNTGIS